MNLFDPNIEGIDYWIYSPCQSFIDWYKCCRDGIMTIDLNESGDTPAPFSDKETIERQFEDEIERGDVIIAKKTIILCLDMVLLYPMLSTLNLTLALKVFAMCIGYNKEFGQFQVARQRAA